MCIVQLQFGFRVHTYMCVSCTAKVQGSSLLWLNVNHIHGMFCDDYLGIPSTDSLHDTHADRVSPLPPILEGTEGWQVVFGLGNDK